MTTAPAMSNPPRAPDARALRHVAIRASAGSGKTYQLTARYLQLIAAGAAPEQILASTFTRLAAGEIRDRLLNDVAAAVDDAPQRAELATRLRLERLTRTDALQLLAALAGRLHQMQVRTLDSFFSSIVRAFALELELPIGAAIVEPEQAEHLRGEAIRLMLDEQKPQDLVDLLRWLTQGASDRGVMKTIDWTVNTLYELFREAPDQVWECVPELNGRLTHAHLATAIERFEQITCRDSRAANAHTTACERVRRHAWDDFLVAGLARPIASGANAYYGEAIDPSIVAEYLPLVNHARAELVHRIRQQTLATRDLLKLFHSHYQAVKHRRRALTFADLTAALARAESLGKLDEIGFRLDARLRHILLDEFQDTSIAQWRALRPLIDELICVAPPERTFFCVGDVKQSIYGWRNAAPELLDHLPEILPGLEEENLSDNYRSAPVVIAAVNQVFEGIAHNPALADHAEAARAFAAGFSRHDAGGKNAAYSGYVELRAGPRAERESDEQKKDVQRLNAAADLVRDVLARRSDLSIAVLTRTNQAVARMLFELGPSRRNVPASGRGGGPLIDAPAVNAVLDLLQMADHPDDTVAAFNVACSPLGKAVGFTRFDDAAARKRLARRVRRVLLEDGYAKTIGQWVRHIALACDARELRRLLQLVELAGAHDAQPTLRTGDFIRTVEAVAVADVQPAPVQVMTVHQAKGLEFDVVILPELEGALTGSRPPPVVFDRAEGETGPITAVCRYMNKDVREFAPELKPLFERHERRCVRESLSVLYVAMTRAVHALYMIIDPPEINRDGVESTRGSKSMAGVLRAALADGECAPDRVAFALGDTMWWSKVPPKTREAPTSANESGAPIESIRLAPTQPDAALRRGMAAAAASSHQFNLAHQLRPRDDAARQRGTALHAMFESIAWLEEGTIDEQGLIEIALRQIPNCQRGRAQQLAREFLAMIERPPVRATLSRNGTPAARLTLHREFPFVRMLDGRMQSGSIDRLVVQSQPGGALERATIIDFKSDDVSANPARLAERVEIYRPQLQAYRAAVSEMYALDPALIAAQLLFVDRGDVIDV